MLNKVCILQPSMIQQWWPPWPHHKHQTLPETLTPTKKKKKKNPKETLGGMPVHTQKWKPLTMASLLSFYSRRREGACSVPSARSHRPTYPHH
jgi:hypothetical protein